MICEGCKNIVVLHAFSDSNCSRCNEEISTPHIPAYEVCEACSEKEAVCQQCGKQMQILKGL
jgi:hypothetical protein